MNRGKRLALLSVARKRLNLSEDDYRAILADYGGNESARVVILNDDGFDRVMVRLRQLGFESDQFVKGYRRNRYSGMATQAQLGLIRWLWGEVLPDADEAALTTWLQNHHKLDSLRFVPEPTARKIIAGLKAWKARKDAKAAQQALDA